ncbi:MAG: alanine racemase, partial [Ignavibacteriae bacterium]|nr:alanine racemase [Ignavibacteriota bacterium]
MRVSRIEINLSALQHNFSFIKQKVGKDVKIMAVEKDNAYGHGMIPIAKSLEQFGADYLAVAHADE